MASSNGWLDRVAPRLAVLHGLALCAALLALRAHRQTGDAYSYLSSARGEGTLFHPHHLIYPAAVRALHLAAKSTGTSDDVLLAAQLHNLLFVAVALAAAYLVGSRWRGAPRWGLVASVAVGSLNGLLVFATQAEVYVPAVAGLLVATALLIPDQRGRARTIAVAAAWLLAILYHQTAVLFAVPLLGLGWRRRGRGGLREAATIGALAAGTALLAYAAAFRLEPRRGGLWRWIFLYAARDEPSWGAVANIAPAGLRDLLQRLAWAFSQAAADDPWAWRVGAVGVLALFVGAVLRRSARDELIGFTATWLAAELLFFLWWLPGEREFAILSALPGALGLAALTASWPGGRHFAAPLVALAVASSVANLRGEIAERHRDRSRQAAMAELVAIGGDDCEIWVRHDTRTAYLFEHPGQRRRVPRAPPLLRRLAAGERTVVGSATCLVVAWDLLPAGAGTTAGPARQAAIRRLVSGLLALDHRPPHVTVDSWEVLATRYHGPALRIHRGRRQSAPSEEAVMAALTDALEPFASGTTAGLQPSS